MSSLKTSERSLDHDLKTSCLKTSLRHLIESKDVLRERPLSRHLWDTWERAPEREQRCLEVMRELFRDPVSSDLSERHLRESKERAKSWERSLDTGPPCRPLFRGNIGLFCEKRSLDTGSRETSLMTSIQYREVSFRKRALYSLQNEVYRVALYRETSFRIERPLFAKERSRYRPLFAKERSRYRPLFAKEFLCIPVSRDLSHDLERGHEREVMREVSRDLSHVI